MVLPASSESLKQLAISRPLRKLDKDSEQISLECEYSILKVLKTELEGMEALHKMKTSLKKRVDFNVRFLFEALAQGKAHINLTDMRAVYKRQRKHAFGEDIVAIMRRLDKDNDGVISYLEFYDALQCYSSSPENERGRSSSSISRAKAIRRSVERLSKRQPSRKTDCSACFVNSINDAVNTSMQQMQRNQRSQKAFGQFSPSEKKPPRKPLKIFKSFGTKTENSKQYPINKRKTPIKTPNKKRSNILKSKTPNTQFRSSAQKHLKLANSSSRPKFSTSTLPKDQAKSHQTQKAKRPSSAQKQKGNHTHLSTQNYKTTKPFNFHFPGNKMLRRPASAEPHKVYLNQDQIQGTVAGRYSPLRYGPREPTAFKQNYTPEVNRHFHHLQHTPQYDTALPATPPHQFRTSATHMTDPNQIDELDEMDEINAMSGVKRERERVSGKQDPARQLREDMLRVRDKFYNMIHYPVVSGFGIGGREEKEIAVKSAREIGEREGMGAMRKSVCEEIDLEKEIKQIESVRWQRSKDQCDDDILKLKMSLREKQIEENYPEQLKLLQENWEVEHEQEQERELKQEDLDVLKQYEYLSIKKDHTSSKQKIIDLFLHQIKLHDFVELSKQKLGILHPQNNK
jgi:hypothetical protein